MAVNKLTNFEGVRGNMAAWFLIAFGLVYFVWGLRRAYKGKTHTHKHIHSNGTVHSHKHSHTEDHVHLHKTKNSKKELTPWILFTIFVLGPCEPLIPILMYPAAKNSWASVALVAGIFSIITITTMMLAVGFLLYGINYLPQKSVIERYMHAIAGATICLCGVSIQFLGL
jgi:sulfite exporter TauE/SafE